MKIRRAELGEARAISDVWLRSRLASTPRIPSPVHSDDEVRDYFRRVVLQEHVVWVAEDDGGIIALLALDGDWVEHLYVDPDHWGDGVGSQLLAVAKRERPERLKLWTFQANSGARRFYERHGFMAMRSTSGDNEEGAPDVLYQWRRSEVPTLSGPVSIVVEVDVRTDPDTSGRHPRDPAVVPRSPTATGPS